MQENGRGFWGCVGAVLAALITGIMTLMAAGKLSLPFISFQDGATAQPGVAALQIVTVIVNPTLGSQAAAPASTPQVVTVVVTSPPVVQTATPGPLPTVPPTLAEIAAGKPVGASGFYQGSKTFSFAPNAIVDRRTTEIHCDNGTEKGNSYWLLPDHQTGWIEINLQQDYPVAKLRWLNTHNGPCADRATSRFHIALSTTGAFKGEENTVYTGSMPFSTTPGFQEVTLSPASTARFVRFYVDAYYNWGGGLNELEVYAWVPAQR